MLCVAYALYYYYPPVRREWGSKLCFCPSVCQSVCPSVAYMANNSRTQRPSVPKFGLKVPHLRCDWHTSFKVKRSKIKVTRPINADTHPVAYHPMPTYRIPMDVVVRRISRPFPYQYTPNSHAVF